MTTDPTHATPRPPLDLDAIRARRKRALEDSDGWANGLTDRDAEWLLAEVTALRAELDAARAELKLTLDLAIAQGHDLVAARAKALAEMREGVTFALDFNAFLAWHWKARGADVYVNVAMFNAFSDYLRAVLNDAA